MSVREPRAPGDGSCGRGLRETGPDAEPADRRYASGCWQVSRMFPIRYSFRCSSLDRFGGASGVSRMSRYETRAGQGRPAESGEMEAVLGRSATHDSPLDGVRVLLVEDHSMVREVIGRLLGEFGAAVTTAAGVAEGLEAFHRERPDGVLSDIQMGGEDGYALIRRLRALPRDRGGQTPAAGLTGLITAEDRGRVLQAGFQYYVAKPVDARTLVSIVAAPAARSQRARSAVAISGQ